MKSSFGFSLIELIATLAIAAILAVISGSLYSHYLIKTRRTEAAVTLNKLAVAMEQYFSIHHSYAGSNLIDLGFSQPVAHNHYRLAIANADQSGYLIQAIPIAEQLQKDDQCGTLSLNSFNVKNISGRGPIHECW